MIECDKWRQKYVFRELCLKDYEANNVMGFLANYGSNLIEYYYGSIRPKTIPNLPFVEATNITISKI